MYGTFDERGGAVLQVTERRLVLQQARQGHQLHGGRQPVHRPRGAHHHQVAGRDAALHTHRAQFICGREASDRLLLGARPVTYLQQAPYYQY